MFKPSESVYDFAVRLTTLAYNLRMLGDSITDAELIKKLLQVVSERLN